METVESNARKFPIPSHELILHLSFRELFRSKDVLRRILIFMIFIDTYTEMIFNLEQIIISILKFAISYFDLFHFEKEKNNNHNKRDKLIKS